MSAIYASARREGSLSWPRATLALLLGWWTVRMGSGAASWCVLDYLNLAFHEAGHLVFAAFGHIIHYLGGTLGQLLVPLILMVYFVIWRRQLTSAAFSCWWLGESLINVAIYMADARELALPLVGGGDHDWNELFFRFGLLDAESVTRISQSTHLAGVTIMLLGLAWCTTLALPPWRRDLLRDTLDRRLPRLATLFDDRDTPSF